MKIQNQENQQSQITKFKKIEHYIFKYSDKIAQGRFSEVYKGIDQKLNQTIAVKVIQLSSLKTKLAQQLLKNQIQILKQLDHPNIVKCYDVITSVNNCYIIFQFCQTGDLEKILLKNKKFTQEQILGLIYDIYKGLLYLSERSIIHRDLKIANILINSNQTAKISDFGFSTKGKAIFKDISIGTPVYMSPQGLLSQIYSSKTQTWAFGVLIYELLHGQTPLAKCKTQDQLKINSIKKLKITANMSIQLKNFIELCLTVQLKNRPQIKDLSQTPFMQKVCYSLGNYKIPKYLEQTNHSSTLTINDKSILKVQLFKGILTYEQAVAIVHYCRLIYKVSILTQSKIIAQWLKFLISELKISTISQNNSQSKKLMEVINQYYIKYTKQFQNVHNIIMNIDEVIDECEQLKKTKNYNGCLNLLYKETVNLSKCLSLNKLYYFSQTSQVQTYLKSFQQK